MWNQRQPLVLWLAHYRHITAGVSTLQQ
jgi:hypothetical protein